MNDAARFDKHAPVAATFRCSSISGQLGAAPARRWDRSSNRRRSSSSRRWRLVKVDNDAVPALLQRFSIQSIPTLMLVHHSRKIARKSGGMPLPQLLAWAREHADGVKA
ncbi:MULTISPECIES: thioredoxin family protein [Bradyrhizobium]|uniref:thioredoxin family protein n=1 Tax=Bradyrhizobium TaxID=374 RepID=UPI003857EC9E